ncbi:MAG TPA: IS3 family transposase [Verrucomicrobiae bacterium]|nr:IS3 family transposase [Verrucomicrobiae bacterium]
MNKWSEKTETPVTRMVKTAGVAVSKFYQWKDRYGKANEHNAQVPRDHWLEASEKEAILKFHAEYPLEGYRRLCFMMLDRDIVAVSPSSVYRVLHQAGLIQRHARPTRKGRGFEQPLQAHEHWHVDVSHLNVCGTFYYLCSVIDGASRYIVHWEIREAMKESDVEMILQKALEEFPGARPRIISDNGPQFVAKDFKEFIRLAQLTHVRTSPHYPQSNGKKERWYQTLKREAIRPKTPLDLEQARQVVAEFVQHYNQVRLHSAIGYIAPKDKLEGRQEQIWRDRDAKLEAARERRRQKRQEQIALSA